jgi:cleavage stimulation factor subunit 3
MAEYDPSAPLQTNYDVSADDSYQEQDLQFDAADGDDDDYDPSGFSEDAVNADAPITKDSAPSQQPSMPKTVGGFVVDDEDDEEEQQQDAEIPPPSQLNGTTGSHAGLGAVAVSEAENTVIASEPSQDQASAPSTVNGSSSVVPASISDASSSTLPAPVPALSFQNTEQGKQEMSATASAVPSAAATPQPPVPTTTAAPQRASNGSVPPTAITQRLPHDKVGQLEDRIKEDPKADADAWRELIKHYREKGQLDNVRRVYNRFFEVFPSAVSCFLNVYTEILC